MPLVVPGLMSENKSKTEEWQSKLMGKKLGEQTDEVTFAKTELPEKHRVVKEGSFMTMDYDANRLTVHVDDEGTVKKVTAG